jgi:uncharacterized cupin superfamily protein
MPEITVDHAPDSVTLETLVVSSWPIWTCDVSEFPWTYDSKETCYLLEGEVVVTPDDGRPVSIKAGDLVVFPAGMSGRWKVLQAVRKHYRFD